MPLNLSYSKVSEHALIEVDRTLKQGVRQSVNGLNGSKLNTVTHPHRVRYQTLYLGGSSYTNTLGNVSGKVRLLRSAISTGMEQSMPEWTKKMIRQPPQNGNRAREAEV